MFSKIQDLFRTPPAKALASVELEEAKRGLLRSQNSAEYHAQMSAYYEQTIKRLSKYIASENS